MSSSARRLRELLGSDARFEASGIAALEGTLRVVFDNTTHLAPLPETVRRGARTGERVDSQFEGITAARSPGRLYVAKEGAPGNPQRDRHLRRPWRTALDGTDGCDGRERKRRARGASVAPTASALLVLCESNSCGEGERGGPRHLKALRREAGRVGDGDDTAVPTHAAFGRLLDVAVWPDEEDGTHRGPLEESAALWLGVRPRRRCLVGPGTVVRPSRTGGSSAYCSLEACIPRCTDTPWWSDRKKDAEECTKAEMIHVLRASLTAIPGPSASGVGLARRALTWDLVEHTNTSIRRRGSSFPRFAPSRCPPRGSTRMREAEGPTRYGALFRHAGARSLRRHTREAGIASGARAHLSGPRRAPPASRGEAALLRRHHQDPCGGAARPLAAGRRLRLRGGRDLDGGRARPWKAFASKFCPPARAGRPRPVRAESATSDVNSTTRHRWIETIGVSPVRRDFEADPKRWRRSIIVRRRGRCAVWRCWAQVRARRPRSGCTPWCGSSSSCATHSEILLRAREHELGLGVVDCVARESLVNGSWRAGTRRPPTGTRRSSPCSWPSASISVVAPSHATFRDVLLACNGARMALSSVVPAC